MKADEFLPEMTWRGPNFDTVAKQFGEQNAERWKVGGIHVGDIEQFAVIKSGKYYSVWDNDVLVAFSSLSDSANEVDDVWVSEEYRGQKIFSKLLWFYKTRLGKSPLMLGSTHSSKMQEVVNGLTYFRKFWKNISTNAEEPFSLDTLNNFYSSAGITPWRLMLENTNDFSDWPKFTTGDSFIKESYAPYVE